MTLSQADIDSLLGPQPADSVESLLDAPVTGEDISLALQDPTFKPSPEDYAKFEEYAKTRQTDWLDTIAKSVDVAATMIGGALAEGAQGAAVNPLNYIEGAAQGTRQLYGLVAQSQDPASPLFKFKDLVAGTGTPESRYQQFLEARDFANTSARLERGEEGLFVPPELTNPEFVQGVSMILDPTLALPGIGEVFGAGKLATKAVGRGAQLAGRAVTGVAAPVERLVTGAERIAGEALSVSPEALRTTAATTGIAGALGIAPEAAALAAVPAAVRTTREVGEAISRAGENLMTQPSRIGPLEAIGAAPGANMRQRMLGVIGQYGGDAALDAALRSTAGAIEGATIGTVLGGLSGGEEGAAAGLGTGMVQGAAGAIGARGIERLTGKAARDARAGDLGRFIDAQQDPTTKALFERVRDTHGVDAASALMDLGALVKGTLGDIDINYLSDADFVEKYKGGRARGAQIEVGDRPVLDINADFIGRGQGDTPLYTLGHELFHALEKSKQLSGAATEIKDALVGRWIQEGDTIRKLAEGALTDADIEARFNQYRDKLAVGNPKAAADLAQYDTINKKADYIASEVAAEHFARLLAGQKPDALLKGFSGLTRQLMDAALTQNAIKSIANAAASIERTFGVKPTDSVLFPDLKQASPQLNAMLRDLVRARRRLDEKILLDSDHGGRVLKPEDVGNPLAARELVDMGVAEQMPDGSIRNLSTEEIRARDDRDMKSLRSITENIPGAAMVDGAILGRFSPQQLSAIEQSQAISSRMKDKIRGVNAAMEAGNSIHVVYSAALKRAFNRITKKYSPKYDSGIRVSEREVLPYAFYLSKADNPLVKVIDITKVRNALTKELAKDGSIGGLWGNVDGFMSDLAKYFTNLDQKEGARRSYEIFGDAKARFLGDFVNAQEKGGRKFVRDLRLDRIGAMSPMDFRARISEDAIQLSKDRWMPAEKIGDKDVLNSENGYRIISGAKHKLYGPDGKLLGIFDTQTQAERKADAAQARLQPEVDQQQRPARDEGRQAAEAGRGDRALGRPQGQAEGGAVRQAGDVRARFMAASEADPSQPSTQAIRSVKGQRAVNSLYQFDYTYKTKSPGKPAREKTATETISAFSISEAKEKAKAAIMKELKDDPTVLRSTISISQPEIKGQFAVTELTGKPADPKSPKIVLNPGTPQKFTSMFNAVDAALDSVKDSPAIGLDSDGWIKAYSRALNGSRASVPPAPLRLAQWVQDNGAFRKFIEDGLQRNPELVKSAVGGLNALQPIHELARQGQIPSKMVALHMFWGLLSRMLDPYNQEAGWARLTSEPKVLRLIEDSVEGRYRFTKDQWKEIVSTKMSEFPDVSVGRNAIQNANAFHEMLSRWNGRWDELTSIINNPDLTGPQMRRQFNEKGFGGAGIKHKVLSFVLATLARNDVFVGDRWQVVNLWFPHLEKAAAARKAQGGSPEVFAYDRNGVPEDTTGAYKVIGGMLNNETVAETAYSLIENGMRKIAAESPWLREMLGRKPQPFDIHWLTWNIIKNEPVGHSSLDATAKFLTENLYGDPEFAQKFAETEKRTEKYAKGVFDVFSVKGQERPQIRQRPGADDGGAGAAGIGPDAGRGPGGSAGPSAAGAGEVGVQRFMPAGGEKLYEQTAEQPGRRGDRGEGRYTSGNLAPLAGAPQVKGASGPDTSLVEVAEKYAKDNGINLRRQSEYVDVNEDRARRIAQAYDEMPHAPQDPAVREAYQDLIRQTTDQYRALDSAGYKFWFIDINSDAGQQYTSSPFNAMRDLRANKSMGVFPTDSGFGTKEDFNPDSNPMLADTGLRWPFGGPNGELRTVYANDLFRAVHDAFGHGLEGSGFRARGEENAWQAHIRLFTGPARGAITTETRGQNSWLNYGPYGERNRTAKTEDTVFADQKTGLMPEWTWTEGLAADEVATPQGEVGAPRYMPSDAAYLDAVQKGDTQAAQRMVDEAAKAAGYTVGPVYHGTHKKFNEFITSEGAHFGTLEQAKNRVSETSWRGASPSVDRYHIKGNFLRLDDVGEWDRPEKIVSKLVKTGFFDKAYGDRLRRIAKRSPDDARYALFEDVKDAGFDGFVYSNRVEGKGDSYMVLDPNQVKLADPVTKDSQGNVIPLSKRFQASSEDIRYMPTSEQDTKALKMLPKPRRSLDAAYQDGVKTRSQDPQFYDIPDYVGYDMARTAAFEMGREGAEPPRWVMAERIGKLPTEGRSKNFAEDKMERGVSALRIVGEPQADVGTYEMFNPGEKRYIAGWLVGLGSDGEPLLADAVDLGPVSGDVRMMPQPDSSMPGAYSFQGGYRAIPGKAKGSLRLYGPAGSLIGIASSLEEAQRIIRRKTRP